MQTRKTSALVALSMVLAIAPAHAQTQGMERRDDRGDARDTRQEGRQDARDAKQECKDGTTALLNAAN